MKKLAKIIRAEPAQSHALTVWFDDGAFGVWHSNIVSRQGPMALPLHDPRFFARVSIEDSALVWPNGWDASADYVREEMRLAGHLVSNLAAAE
jgi:Protein of unknown function (DUF2442)